jgi:hypothetical protein
MSGVGALVVALVLAGAGEPTAPKLDPAPATPPAAAEEPAPARRLPRTVAVCRDDAARRCWKAPRATDCAVDGLYRVVIDEPGRTDADEALAACSAEVAGEGPR